MNDKKISYLVFSLDHDREKAITEFEKRFGKKPEKITEDCNYLWLGPIPEKEEVPDAV
jgi:hypothetical protein